MHELLLFAQVLPSRHDQLLQILAGVTGMQPQRVVERHLIFKPSRSPGQTSAQVGGSQGVQNAQLQAIQGQLHNELYYLQLVGEVNDSRFGGRTPLNTNVSEQENLDLREGESDEEGNDGAQLKGDQHQQPRQSWTLHFKDIPEVAGRRPVTSRMMLSVDILDGDAFAFMDALGYTCVRRWGEQIASLD
jgi:mediator of RNA polymerase II transcription subunit 18